MSDQNGNRAIMRRRSTPPVDIEIDADYEKRVDYLDDLPVVETAIEPARPVQAEALRAQPPAAWVPGQTAQPSSELQLGFSGAESQFMEQAHRAVGAVINAPMREREHSGHTRQTDNAMGVAKATVYVAWQSMIPIAGAMVGLLVLVWALAGGPVGYYVAFYIFALGAIGAAALYKNRSIGLHHSSTGIAHHELEVAAAEIASRERIALGVVDRHIALLEKKMALEERRNDGSR
ncbi:MAG: hypothetical protein E6Q97_25470 [Desulfurellales bacterium]|nr:MAG: hypothetical protein E6Q97_25470 [Desulfurellales bacterium]